MAGRNRQVGSLFNFRKMKYVSLAYLFVAVQFTCLILIAATGKLLSSTEWGILLESAGVFLAFVAIYQMKIGNFNVVPIPKTEGQLVTHGVYQYIRHPMYLAQLIATFPLIVEDYTMPRLAVWIILMFNLVFKLHYEEKLLIRHFKGYHEYMQSSWRLIPYVY